MNARAVLGIVAVSGLMAACGGASGALTQSAPAPVRGATSDGRPLTESGDGSTFQQQVPTQHDGGVPGNATVVVSGSAPRGNSPPQPLPIGVPAGQQIERSVTAAYVVPHGTFLDSFNSVIAAGARLGGYVDSSTTTPDGHGAIVSGTVTMKIPADKLSDLLAALPADFQTSSIDFASVDHTAQYVDLNAQLKAANAHHDVLLKLLSGATNLGDITNLEQQIAAVEQQINQLQGSLDQVQHSVDYATATISLSEKGAAVPAPAPGPSAFQPLLDAAGTGLANARGVVAAIITTLLSVLPLILVAVVGFVTRHRWMRPLIRSGATRRGAADTVS